MHIETCPHVFRTLEEIKTLGCKAGVTLNPGTPVRALEAVLPHAELVLIMSVNPGFSFQSFLPDAIGRVREVRRMLDELKSSAHLEVDGGVSPENIAAVGGCRRGCVRQRQLRLSAPSRRRSGCAGVAPGGIRSRPDPGASGVDARAILRPRASSGKEDDRPKMQAGRFFIFAVTTDK